MALTKDDAVKLLLKARKIGETPDWAIIGKDPDNAGNPFQAQLDTGETNVVYATVKGNPDPQIIYYDPSVDLRLLQYGARVELEWRNGRAWVKGADKEYLTQQQAGTPLPTGNVPLREHDHTSAAEGGTLGANTVDTTQLVDDSVTQSKIDAGAVNTTELADNAVTNAKMADNSVDTVELVDGAVTNAKIANDAVKVANLNNLTISTNGYVRQVSSDTFLTEKYNTTNAVAPTTSDDNTAGYTLLSRWFDISTAFREWLAFDVSTAAAVWKRYLFSGDVVPTDVDTLDGASTAFVVQTSSDTFDQIDYTFGSNRNVLYDGTDLRSQYVELCETAGFTTSGTTTSVIDTSSDLASIANTSTLIVQGMSTFSMRGSVLSDIFTFYWEYNYDSSGSEAWYQYERAQQMINGATGVRIDAITLVCNFYGANMTSPAWGYSGTYKLRLTVARATGTGTLQIFDTSASFVKQTTFIELEQ